MITTADFPQADILEQVGNVAIAIFNGKRTDDDIENFIGLRSKGRQGRYYRLAAEKLGLVSNSYNNASLTPLGDEYAKIGSKSARMDFLSRRLIDTPVFAEALRYIHEYNPNENELKFWFKAYYPGSGNTAGRRFSTFINYLNESGLIQYSNASYHIQKYVGNILKKSSFQSLNLKGCSTKNTTSAPPSTISSGTFRIDIDMQKLERAKLAHWQLVDAKSLFLDNRGIEPFFNEHIDLFANDKGNVIIYEMKSVNQIGSNLLSQIRKAVSQLYEYRFIYKVPKARLCIVTNHYIANKDQWLLNYLARDREIAYEWTEDFAKFGCNEEASHLLANFSPQ